MNNQNQIRNPDILARKALAALAEWYRAELAEDEQDDDVATLREIYQLLFKIRMEQKERYNKSLIGGNF